MLLVVDANDSKMHHETTHEVKSILPNEVPVITVFNKIDTLGLSPKVEALSVYLCAKDGSGLDKLKTLIKQVVGYQPSEGLFLARRRHLLALDAARTQLLTGQTQLIEHQAGELLAEDLRIAHHYLCEITGEFTSDDLLGHIFSSFCIGK